MHLSIPGHRVEFETVVNVTQKGRYREESAQSLTKPHWLVSLLLACFHNSLSPICVSVSCSMGIDESRISFITLAFLAHCYRSVILRLTLAFRGHNSKIIMCFAQITGSVRLIRRLSKKETSMAE